ncbi:hypothetical protein DIPPA_00973, partial [Diplonema papillatum]
MGDVIELAPTNCRFPAEDVRRITVRALQSYQGSSWRVSRVELFTGGSYRHLWGRTWRSEFGIVDNAGDFDFVDLETPVPSTLVPLTAAPLTNTPINSIHVRISTATYAEDQWSVTADKYEVYYHFYSETTLVHTVNGAAAGEIVNVTADLAYDVSELAYVSIRYAGSASDGWVVATVELFRDNAYHELYCPDSKGGRIQVDSGTGEVFEAEWFDLNAKPTVNTIKTMWTTSGTAGSTDLYLVFYHSKHGRVCYGGVVYDPEKSSAWVLETTDCSFSLSDLRKVSVRAVTPNQGNSWQVHSVELISGSYRSLWGQTWGAYSGTVDATQEFLFVDLTTSAPMTTAPATDVPVTEIPGTLAPVNSMEIRITTSTVQYSETVEPFAIFFHFYNESLLVSTHPNAAKGDIDTFTATVAHDISELAYVSVKSVGVGNDGWQLESVEVYRDGAYHKMFLPDGEPAISKGNAEAKKIELEYFDTDPRQLVNAVQTLITTDDIAGAESVDAFMVFLHSSHRVHYAGAVFNPQKSDVLNVTTENSPFPAEEVLQVSIRAVATTTSDDWKVSSVELLTDGARRMLWGRTWKSYSGVVGYNLGQNEEPFFVDLLTPAPPTLPPATAAPATPTPSASLKVRVTTSTATYSDSADLFSFYFHFYEETVLAATQAGSGKGEIAIIGANVPYTADELVCLSIVFNGTASDGWILDRVDLLRDGVWQKLFAPDAPTGTYWIDDDTGYSELAFFDLNSKTARNTVRTTWATDTLSDSQSTDIFTVFLHSADSVHYAGVIYDPEAGQPWEIVAENCP